MVADSVNVYDKEKLYTDCTIQILSNSITGQTSLGWRINREIKPGKWRSIDEEPPRDRCYLVLWKVMKILSPQDRQLFYEIVYYDQDGIWNVEDDIPQAFEGNGGAEILFWMPLPEKPEVM